MNYDEFLSKKQFTDLRAGFDVSTDTLCYHDAEKQLFDFQRAIVRWALARGRAALFEDTGLGKTAQQCIWANEVAKCECGRVLIFAPLAVAKQTQEEAATFGVHVEYVRSQAEVDSTFPGIYVTNYEMHHHFDPDNFAGVVLDESSILKNQTGRTRNEMIERWGTVPYRLSCTATPSPNDFMELGNQAQFLGIMSMSEMLAMFFTHDGSSTQNWRLKGHGRKKFWEWLATWAVFVRKPSDLGFDDTGYDLPPLNVIEHQIKIAKPVDGDLFAEPAKTLQERREAKRESITGRAAMAADLINNSDDSWIAWCYLNDEQATLNKAITRANATSVQGSDSMDAKEERLLGFSHGKYPVLTTKPSIAGFGMNWQHSHNMVFVGLDDSFEKFYQAVRRQYRFGQKHPVNVHIVTSDGEGAIKANIERKMAQHEEMAAEMVEHMRDIMQKHVTGACTDKTEYTANKTMRVPEWLK